MPPKASAKAAATKAAPKVEAPKKIEAPKKVAAVATKTKAAPVAKIEAPKKAAPATTTTTKAATKKASPAPQGNGFAQAVAPATVTKAVKALRAFLTGETAASKKLIENENGYFELQINLRKAQIKSKSLSIPLTNSIYKRPGVSICLFTKDPQDRWEEYLLENPVSNVTRIVGLKKLGTDFKPFEHRRLLLKQHDLFLADDAIVPMLKQMLGTTFYKSSKLPVGVPLNRKFKVSLQKARDSTHFRIPEGQTFNIRVAHADFTDEQIIENIIKFIPLLEEKLPKGISSILLKTEFSSSIPLYVNLAIKEDFVATVEETKMKLEKTLRSKQNAIESNAKKLKISVDKLKAVQAAAKRCQMTVPKYISIAKRRGVDLGQDVERTQKVKKSETKMADAAPAATATAAAATTAPAAVEKKPLNKKAAVVPVKKAEETIKVDQPTAATKRKGAPKADVEEAVQEAPVKKVIKKLRK